MHHISFHKRCTEPCLSTTPDPIARNLPQVRKDRLESRRLRSGEEHLAELRLYRSPPTVQDRIFAVSAKRQRQCAAPYSGPTLRSRSTGSCAAMHASAIIFTHPAVTDHTAAARDLAQHHVADIHNLLQQVKRGPSADNDTPRPRRCEGLLRTPPQPASRLPSPSPRRATRTRGTRRTAPSRAPRRSARRPVTLPPRWRRAAVRA